MDRKLILVRKLDLLQSLTLTSSIYLHNWINKTKTFTEVFYTL